MNPRVERDYQIIDEIKYLESIKQVIDNRIMMLKHRENSFRLQSEMQQQNINAEIEKVLNEVSR